MRPLRLSAAGGYRLYGNLRHRCQSYVIQDPFRHYCETRSGLRASRHCHRLPQFITARGRLRRGPGSVPRRGLCMVLEASDLWPEAVTSRVGLHH